MFKNNPQFFIKFLFFCQHTVFVFEELRFAENTIKIVFSGKHSFSKTQLVKPTFSPMSKNTFFQKKVSFLVLGHFRWNHYFYSFSWFTLFWAKKILAKTDSVHENARFFSKTSFLTSPKFAKTLFWHTVALFVFLKMPQNTIKLGEKQQKKNLDQFLTLDLDQVLTLEPPNLGPVFNSTAYIYIYVYIYICCRVIIWAKFGPFQ